MYTLHLPSVSSLQSIQKPAFLHSSAACSREEQTPFLHESNLQFFFLIIRFTCWLQFEKTLRNKQKTRDDKTCFSYINCLTPRRISWQCICVCVCTYGWSRSSHSMLEGQEVGVRGVLVGTGVVGEWQGTFLGAETQAGFRGSSYTQS